MMNSVQLTEYRRQVFNKALLECFSMFENACCDINVKEEPFNAATAKKMTDDFYTDLLKLDKSTIAQTKKALEEAVTFVQDCIAVSESIADMKCLSAEQGPDDKSGEPAEAPEVELSDEDKAVIDKLFAEKGPDVQVAAVRDDIVNALVAENKKAEEIKDALNMANSRVAAGDDTEAVNETVERLSAVGPTSLMNAIMNCCSGLAIRACNENASEPVSVDKVMSEHATAIRERSVMLYGLYESAQVLGIHNYTKEEMDKICADIYYNK